MSSHSPIESVQYHGCTVVLRHFEGPDSLELFFSCQPPKGSETSDQSEAIWRAVLEVLESKGGSYSNVMTETVFLRDHSDI